MVDIRHLNAIEHVEILDWVAASDEHIVALIAVENDSRKQLEISGKVSIGAS
jgi:hypothetical protein